MAKTHEMDKSPEGGLGSGDLAGIIQGRINHTNVQNTMEESVPGQTANAEQGKAMPALLSKGPALSTNPSAVEGSDGGMEHCKGNGGNE